MTDILSGRRVLVVEDEMLVLMNIEFALTDLGCSTIFAAATVSESLALLSQCDVDLAIIDVNLAGEKSYPIADALSERGIPFAFSTGCADHGSRTDLDCRPILRKPYVLASLEAVLTRLLNDEPPRHKGASLRPRH
jgi:CheY-like chemotaxis protein